MEEIAGYIFEQEGKLLRPKFSLLLGEALFAHSRKPRDELVRKVKAWSAMVEMIHNSSLLQDDIIDQARTRRNRPTAHTLFSKTTTAILPLFIVGRA